MLEYFDVSDDVDDEADEEGGEFNDCLFKSFANKSNEFGMGANVFDIGWIILLHSISLNKTSVLILFSSPISIVRLFTCDDGLVVPGFFIDFFLIIVPLF